MRSWLLLAAAAVLPGQTIGPDQVLVVVNENSSLSKRIAGYYAQKRTIPAANLCRIRAPEQEAVERAVYDRDIARPIAACLKPLAGRIQFLVTTQGVPLRISGPGSDMETEIAAVDSELTLLAQPAGRPAPRRAGPLANPYFRQRNVPFRAERFGVYLVARLAGFSFEDVRRMIDRALVARNTGKVVLDLRGASEETGNDWLRSAAMLLPAERVIMDETHDLLIQQKDVIGYASWGSNDAARRVRMLGFQWLPGAVVTEFVSTNARTFRRPPDSWAPSRAWNNPLLEFAGAPQNLTADYLAEGATAATGHVYEPKLGFCVRPDLLFPAYLSGRTLAESVYLATPAVSWMNVVIGDPLCRLAR